MDHDLEPAADADAPAVDDAQGQGWVGFAAVAAVAAVVGLNTGTVPAHLAPYALPLALAAAACVAVVRAWRVGLRAQARSHLSQKIREFGGGVYGTVAWGTFIFLEVLDLRDDVAEAGGVIALIQAIDFGWIIEQLVESIGFMVSAMLWPFHWFGGFGSGLAVAVLVGVWTFDGLVKLTVVAVRRLRARSAAEAPVAAVGGSAPPA